MQDMLLIALVVVAMGVGVIGGLSLPLSMFIALRSPPTRRAAWTTGIPYLIVGIGSFFADLQGYESAVPIAAIPGALIVFWFWRMTFRKRWIDDSDHEQLETVPLENNEWSVGLAIVIVAIIFGAARVYLRSW